ncbi:MAG: primosomal protein N' [Lentisphaeria bacterium]|nr:primosomal protein N' [Lentisphaeria bacterium]
MIARVITDIALDREFDYLIPAALENDIRIGSAVEVPFGSTRRNGYVLEICAESAFASTGKLKELSGFARNRAHIPEKLITLGKWMAEYYCATQEHAIRTLLPAAVRSGKVKALVTRVFYLPDQAAAEKFIIENADAKRVVKRIEVLKLLLRIHEGTLTEISGHPEYSPGAFDALRKAGLIAFREETLRRDVFGEAEVVPGKPLPPTPDQQKALAMVEELLDRKVPQHVLVLHGVTNSGKTEVYLQSIAKTLERGKSAIVLVPEISLTPQTVRRFRSRFGDRLCVLHSRLSDGERFDEWNRINSGEAQIVIGARSALFAPFRNLGLIVVDEEHESSYKQSESPRYMARDVAVMRGKLEDAVVILGSATPSAESVYNARQGKFLLCRMEAQVADKPKPVIRIVDRRLDPLPEPGSSNLFSPVLIDAVQERLERAEQTILFLNRRGYARSLCCPACGYEARCPECSVNYNYTYSRRREILSCHLCGAVIPAPECCPECGSPDIIYRGSGTEKLESCAHGVFPGARIGRMDSDTMRSSSDYEVVLDKFRRGQLDILVGTQMIAKGLHFPGVTLVGVINADHGLSMPDFRAAERTFQLLTQVAGRAGRGDRRGEVIFQSSKDSEVLQFAANLDFDGFEQYDLEFRKMLNYPPYTRLIAIVFRGEDESVLAAFAANFAAQLEPYKHANLKITPPAPAPIEKIKNKYRYLMTIRGTGLKTIREAIRVLALHRPLPKNIDIAIDVDAQYLM